MKLASSLDEFCIDIHFLLETSMFFPGDRVKASHASRKDKEKKKTNDTHAYKLA